MDHPKWSGQFCILVWLDNCQPLDRLRHLPPTCRESCNTQPQTILSRDHDLSIIVSARRVQDPGPENGGEDGQNMGDTLLSLYYLCTVNL